MKEVIENFLNPKSIAIIGASNKEGKVGNILVKKISKSNRTLIPVNPKSELILGKKTYSSVLNYPKKIDLAIIAIPNYFVPKALKECGKKKIKNIIIISGGFEEIKNKNLQKRLDKIKKRYKMHILGPNCFGIVNPKINLDTTFSNTTPKKGSIAFLSQSGALWSYLADLNLGFSGFVSLGNMSDLSFTDFLEYYIKDSSTKKIILYIEKLKNGKKFIELCNSTKKQIIVIKAGKTKQGNKAAISHTASLADDYSIYKGAFRQANIKQVTSISKALNLKKQNLQKALKGKELFLIANAGGAGTILTDNLISKGYKIYGPHDLLGTATAKDYKNELNRIREKYDHILVILTPQTMSEPTKTAQELTRSEHKDKIIAIFLGEKSLSESKRILELNKIPFFNLVV